MLIVDSPLNDLEVQKGEGLKAYFIKDLAPENNFLCIQITSFVKNLHLPLHTNLHSTKTRKYLD